MIKTIAIITGAAIIGAVSYLLLREDKTKPIVLDKDVYGFWDNEEDDIYDDEE